MVPNWGSHLSARTAMLIITDHDQPFVSGMKECSSANNYVRDVNLPTAPRHAAGRDLVGGLFNMLTFQTASLAG